MIEDEKCLICNSCQKLYTKKERCPRRLLCGHTFCTSCLANLIETKNRKCPSCLRPFLASSVMQLPTDFTVYKKIAYSSPETETDSQKFSADNKSTLNSPVQANELRNGHITASRDQLQLSGHLGNLSTHHQDEDKLVNPERIVSPTSPASFKFQLPLIARSSSTMARLPAYTGLGGYDEVDVPRERMQVEDISQEDIQTIPPPSSTMYPLPPTTITQVSQQTPITQRSSSDHDASIYRSLQNLNTDISKELQDSTGSLQLPTPTVRTKVQSHPTTQTPGIKHTFSDELPTPIKRSVTAPSQPIPAVRSSLTQQQTAKADQNANQIPDVTKQNSMYSDSGGQLFNSVSTPTQLPPTALTSNVLSNTDICNAGNTIKAPAYSSLKQTHSTKWKPMSTSSPLSWEKTKQPGARNISERLLTTQKTTPELLSKDLSSSAQSKRTSKRPAPNPKTLKGEPFPESTPSKEAQPLSNSNEDKSSLRRPRISKSSTKQRAPNPKPARADLPKIYSPLSYRTLSGTPVNSEALDSPKLTARGEMLNRQNAKRKAPNPSLQLKSARQELSLDKSTLISNINSQEQKHSGPQISQDQNDTLGNGADELLSSQHIQSGQTNSDPSISKRNRLPDTNTETSTAIQIQSLEKSNIPATTLPFITADSKTPKAAITENSIESIRPPTPPSPSGIPVSSDDDKMHVDESSVNSPSNANEAVLLTNNTEMSDGSQGSRTAYKLGLGPVPFKPRATEKDTSTNMFTSDNTQIGHSHYMSGIQKGELQVGEVPSVQEFDNDRNLANTPKSTDEQKSSSSLDTPPDRGIHNNDKIKTEETSEPLKFPNVSQQTSTNPVKRYISPLTKNVHLPASHDSVKQESVTLKYPHIKTESFTINEGNKTSSPQSSKTEVNMGRSKFKSSKHAQSNSDNSSDENLTHDELVHTDTDTEQKKIKCNYPKLAPEKEAITSSISSKQHLRKHTNQKTIIQDNGTTEWQTKSNTTRDMKSDLSKSHGKLAVKSEQHYHDAYGEASFSDSDERSDDQTVSHEKYSKYVESKLDRKYSSNEDTDRRPRSSKNKAPTKKYEEQPRKSNSAPQKKTVGKNNENYIYKEQAEKHHKQHKREQDKTQVRREVKKPARFKTKQEYRNEESESDTSDINTKLQRARHRLKSTLDEPKSASSHREMKTRQENKVKDTYGPQSDQELSESHSDISDRKTNKTKDHHSDSESDTEETESQGHIKINSNGMIVRYPTKDKFSQSQIKNTTESTLRTVEQKKHLRHGKHSGQKNLVEPSDVENYFPGSADEIEINSNGMIMRHPPSKRRQPSQKQNETRAVTSDIKKTNRGKNRSYHNMYYPQTESNETSGNDNSSKTHRDNDWNTSNVNSLLQGGRRSLKSPLDKYSKERAKSHSTHEKSEKKASLFKENMDSDGEITNHKKSKLRTRKGNRATSNDSWVRESENPIDSYPASMPYYTSHDKYKYDERIPKRFYNRVNLNASNKIFLQDWQDNYQPVMNPAFKFEDESRSESENQNSEAYLGSSKYEAQKRKKEAIMPKYHALEGNGSVSSEEFPTDIYADFKLNNYKSKTTLSNDDDSDTTTDITSRKLAKSNITKSDSFLKRTLALTDSQYKSSFHYRPSSQIYTAELALVTNPEDGKTENVKDLGKEMKGMGVGQCTTHGALMDLYCKTCELWVCQECLDIVHRPPPEGHCQTISSDQAVEELRESHSELFDAKIATLEHFKEELKKLLENCEKSLKDHEVSVAQLSSRVLSEKMVIQGIENMKKLVQQKWKQVEQWGDVLEANALRIGQSASSGEIVDALERNKSDILVHVMQGMTGERVQNQTTNSPLW